MGLTGPVFGWTLVTLTIAAFTGLVAFWPRLSGGSVVRVAARAGLLLGVNVLVLLTAAVQLNNTFLFFAGWADLAGAVRGTTATSRMNGGGSAADAASASASGSAASAPATLQPLPAGSRVQEGVTSYTVTGPASGITSTVLVTAPPGYDAADAATTYPVLETFSGYPSTPSQWVKTMRLQSVLETETAAHRVRPMIVVSPQVEIPAGADTECVDGRPTDPKIETWVTKDVPDWVAAHFRVRTERTAWAAIGLSSGGWCAAMTTMLHPAQYGGAVVLGGYFRPLFGAGYDPFPKGSEQAQRYDLVALAKHDPPPVALWVETSHADPVSYDSTAALLRNARAPLSVTTTVLQNAGHRIGVWQGLLPNAIDWLGATLPGFRP